MLGRTAERGRGRSSADFPSPSPACRASSRSAESDSEPGGRSSTRIRRPASSQGSTRCATGPPLGPLADLPSVISRRRRKNRNATQNPTTVAMLPSTNGSMTPAHVDKNSRPCGESGSNFAGAAGCTTCAVIESCGTGLPDELCTCNPMSSRTTRCRFGYSARSIALFRGYSGPMHYDAHQPIIADLEARILTIRDSL